jgi:hypothetical protein
VISNNALKLKIIYNHYHFVKLARHLKQCFEVKKPGRFFKQSSVLELDGKALAKVGLLVIEIYFTLRTNQLALGVFIQNMNFWSVDTHFVLANVNLAGRQKIEKLQFLLPDRLCRPTGYVVRQIVSSDRLCRPTDCVVRPKICVLCKQACCLGFAKFRNRVFFVLRAELGTAKESCELTCRRVNFLPQMSQGNL